MTVATIAAATTKKWSLVETLQAIVIVSWQDDIHALAVADRINALYENQCRAVVVDEACFPLAGSLTFHAQGGESRGHVSAAGALPFFHKLSSTAMQEMMREIALGIEDIRSVWWRRPRAPTPFDYPNDHVKKFCKLNTQDLFLSIFQSISGEIRVVNNPSREGTASLKVCQLQAAMESGLRVPDTCITNAPYEAKTFMQKNWEADRAVISKVLRSVDDKATHTRSLTEVDLLRLDEVAMCPTIFQQEVRGGVDVRAISIGREVIAVKQIKPEGADIPDVRCYSDHLSYKEFELPPDVVTGLRKLMNRLGLEFGVHDLISDAEGNWHYLETNPCGQWLFLELNTDVSFSERIARFLWAPGAETLSTTKPYTVAQLQAMLPHRDEDVINRALGSDRRVSADKSPAAQKPA